MSSRRHWLLLAVVPFVAADGRAEVRAQQVPDSLEIRGSGSVLPLAQHVAEAYMLDHPDSIVVVSSGGNRRGLESLVLGTCEMAMAGTQIPDDIEKLAAENKVELVSTDIYQDAVVVVVNPKNPIKDISMKQLRDVFRGAITNWSELGGKEAPIAVVTHDGSSSTFEVFKRAVLRDDAVITPKALVPEHEAFEQTITETAIGYAGLHVPGSSRLSPSMGSWRPSRRSPRPPIQSGARCASTSGSRRARSARPSSSTSSLRTRARRSSARWATFRCDDDDDAGGKVRPLPAHRARARPGRLQESSRNGDAAHRRLEHDERIPRARREGVRGEEPVGERRLRGGRVDGGARRAEARRDRRRRRGATDQAGGGRHLPA